MKRPKQAPARRGWRIFSAFITALTSSIDLQASKVLKRLMARITSPNICAWRAVGHEHGDVKEVKLMYAIRQSKQGVWSI